MSGAAHAVRVQGPDGTDTTGDPVPVNLVAGGVILGSTNVPGRGDGQADNAIVGIGVAAAIELWNETTDDRQRGNVERTLLVSAVRNSTTASPDQTNHNARGVIIFLDVTASGGGAGITLRIQGKEPQGSASYFTLNAPPAAIVANGVTAYILYPGALNAAGDVAQVSGSLLPRTWRVNVVHGDGANNTYSVGCALIL